MWIKIAGILLRNRVAFIVGVLLITVFMGFQIPKVEMSYEYSNLLPATDSAYLDYLDFHEKFGQEGNVMVFAIQDKDFYQLDKMNDWISMCDSLKTLHGIVALVDITHSFNLHKDTLNKKFDIQPIFPNHIKDQRELDSLVNIIENLPFYDGTLFNKKKDIYGMMVSVSAEVMNSPARVGLVKDILEITEHFSEKHDLQMHYSGLPYIRVVNAENTVVLGTMVTRFLPFLIFPEGKTPPAYIQYLGKVLPYAVIGLLVIYCLKDVPASSTYGLPEAIAILFIMVLHKWKKNTLLSIGGGTILYMILVQMVF